MMTFDELLNVLPDTLPASEELKLAFGAQSVAPVALQPGREAAWSLKATFQLRGKTSAAAGISSEGFESTIAALGRLTPDDSVLLYAFSGLQQVFSVFVREADDCVLGCIRIDKRK